MMNMAEKVLMIALSPTMDSGLIARWHKGEGDRVEIGDVICEVETDKATMDYESTQEGVILKQLVKEGEKAGIGDTIAIIGEPGEDISALLDDDRPLSGAGLSETVHETMDSLKGTARDSETAIDQGSGKAGEIEGGRRIKASPLARRLAEEGGIPLDRIKGSGPDGRIVKADVEAYSAGLDNDTHMPAVDKAPAMQTVAKKPFDRQAAVDKAGVMPADKVRYVPVTGKRNIIASRLSESMYSAPHYYLTVSVVADNLIETRRHLNESTGSKVSYNALLIKYVAEALKRHPMVNASWLGDRIALFTSADIGLAVAQPDGLITPVVRDCGNKGILAIENELKDLIEKARNNSLLPEEYQGAGFTISNLGSYGIEQFTAIINPPASAILAVGAMKRTPVVDDDGQIAVKTIMKLTLSCDHRVIDGAVGAAFLKNLKDIIEDPLSALY